MTTKDLDQWLDYIAETHPSEIEMGLDRVKSVFLKLPNHTTQAKVVLVAGTNGKGSTIAMIEASLLALGHTVGVYTSPHILAYNERVRVNAINISDSELVSAFETVESVRESTALTYFEFGTLAGLNILFAKDLDVILLEIGLGGRLDAVNIVDPDLSIITSVGLDHVDWLGDTVEKIGIEKAGILREGGLFIGGEGLPETVHHISEELSCNGLICRRDFDAVTDDERNSLKLTDQHQIREFSGFPKSVLPENNILISLQATLCLYDLLNKHSVFTQPLYDHLISTIENVNIPGRLEHVIQDDWHNVFLDVGHNPHAAIYLKEFLLQYADSNTLIQIVYSSLIDKDVLGVLESLSHVAQRCVLTQLDCDRAMHLKDLSELAKVAGFDVIEAYSDANKAFEHALNFPSGIKNTHNKVVTLILGSFFMVEAAKRYLRNYD